MIYKSHGANTISIPKRSIANTTSSTKQTQTHTPSEPKSKKKETRHFWEHFNLPKPPTKNSDSFLVGSFNPFEKYARQTGSSPPKIRVYKN